MATKKHAAKSKAKNRVSIMMGGVGPQGWRQMNAFGIKRVPKKKGDNFHGRDTEVQLPDGWDFKIDPPGTPRGYDRGFGPDIGFYDEYGILRLRICRDLNKQYAERRRARAMRNSRLKIAA